VARNSQRSRRRRRQTGAGGPAAGSGRTERRDSGLEPTEVDFGGDTPPPEPTKHAFPDVEEARLAEEGPVGEGVPDTEPSALDQVGPPPRAPIEHEHDHRAGAGGGNRLFSFLGHVVDELRRVQWPDRRQVGQSTLVVLLFVIIAGSYLGLLDAIWQPLIKAIL
jgi:preprotein translocase SecE subunit